MSKRKLYAIAGVAVSALAGGGAALAVGNDDHAVTGGKAHRARAAAVTFAGGGRGGSVELDGEHGATYDVEVHRGDGSTLDVWLDGSFRPIASEVDEESG